MIGRIVDVSTDGLALSVHRGFLVVKQIDQGGGELGRVPINDVDALIIHANAITISNALTVRLATQGSPVVYCNPFHQVVAFSLPLVGHHLQARRFDAQLEASRPIKKRLWAEIIKLKVLQQAVVLESVGLNAGRLKKLALEVKSGDPQNIEGQAARVYWQKLMGPDFRRQRDSKDVTNSLLNYGYAVIRASVTRAVVGAGLHPTLAIFHQNEGNPLRLVDDLMEPFRPFVDLCVWTLVNSGTTEINRESKTTCVEILAQDLEIDGGTTPVGMAPVQLATSLARIYLGEQEKLDLFEPQVPFEMLEQAQLIVSGEMAC